MEHGDINNFKANVLLIMERKKMSMADIAKRLSISPATVGEILQTGKPRTTTLLRFASALGVTISILTKPVTLEEYGAAFIPRY